MSASLVGSEMCIRDRAPPQLAGRWASRPATTRPPLRAKRRGGRRRRPVTRAPPRQRSGPAKGALDAAAAEIAER
eukprot:10436677-Alexandrium_andersonii.AAC.1